MWWKKRWMLELAIAVMFWGIGMLFCVAVTSYLDHRKPAWWEPFPPPLAFFVWPVALLMFTAAQLWRSVTWCAGRLWRLLRLDRLRSRMTRWWASRKR